MKKIDYFILFAALLFLFIAGCTSSQYSKKALEDLSTCLASKEVVEYGAFWCPNCAKQEKMFGKAFSIIKEKIYVECDPRCDVPDIENLPVACRDKLGNPELCIEKKIAGYPTWDFPNGKRFVGVQDLKSLADEAGCELNE